MMKAKGGRSCGLARVGAKVDLGGVGDWMGLVWRASDGTL